MPITTTIIDPNGDLVLVLKNPIYSFQAFQEVARPENPPQNAVADLYLFGQSLPKSIDSLEDEFNTLSLAADTVESTADVEAKDQSDQDEDDQFGEQENTEDAEFHFLVSSSQLRIVSRYFDVIFKREFLESKIQEDGKYRVETQDFHPKALEHVLNVVHVQNRRVPKKLPLRMLAHICLIVDYYDMKDAFFPWAALWTNSLKLYDIHVGRGAVYGERNIWLIFVGLVFEREREFKMSRLHAGPRVPTGRQRSQQAFQLATSLRGDHDPQDQRAE